MASRRTKVLAGLAMFVVAWIVFWSIDYEYEETTALGGGTTLVKRMHVVRQAWFGMAEGGKSIWLPIPFTSTVLAAEELRRGDRIVWRNPGGVSYEFYVNPKRTRVLLQDELHTEPWRVVSLADGSIVTVDAPRHFNTVMHTFVYPFAFREWDQDSRLIKAEVNGAGTATSREPSSWRELWSVDSDNGQSVRTEHCEVPGYDKPRWTGTPCVGDAAKPKARVP